MRSISPALRKKPVSDNPVACKTAWIIPGNVVKKKAPYSGPSTVPAPPIITIAIKIIEYKRLNVPGSDPPNVLEINAPAIPA